MSDKIKQDDVNKAVWAACDTFRGTVAADIYKDYVLTMLFLKYISDVWQDHYDAYARDYGETPELIIEMMKNERFVLPEGASFSALYNRRHEPGNGERSGGCKRPAEWRTEYVQFREVDRILREGMLNGLSGFHRTRI